jgi:hypothetical protein
MQMVPTGSTFDVELHAPGHVVEADPGKMFLREPHTTPLPVRVEPHGRVRVADELADDV